MYDHMRSIFLLTISLIGLTTAPTAQSVEFETDSTLVDGTLYINDAYSLPTDPGFDGQVITSNGTGQSYWRSPTTYTDPGVYIYMVPYVCGYKDTGFPSVENRNDGEYQTSVLIANPAYSTAFISRYVTLTHESLDPLIAPDSIRAPAPDINTESLSRFYSYALTCDEIFTSLGSLVSPLTPTFEGYVILESSEEIKVSASYTYTNVSLEVEAMQNGIGLGVGTGTSIDVEQIDGIFIPLLPERN